MALIDFILNLAALILWVNWRGRKFDPLVRTTPATLVGTLKRTENRPLLSWQVAAALILLLGGRALFYWFIGAPVDWTPKLDLGLISLAFRSDVLRLDLLYSALSFFRLIMIFYFWLLVLAAINRAVLDPDPLQRFVRLHLGRTARWPWPLQFVLPVLMVAALWLPLSPLLAQLNLVNPVHSFVQASYQGLLVGLGLFLSLKYLIPFLLFLYAITSYVFFGNSAFWDFVSTTGRNLLKPLRSLPLRFARLDLAPVVGAVLVLLALQWLPHFIVGKMAQWKMSPWPQ